MEKQKILFFSPHSAIWAHAFPEALVAENLEKNGHEIEYVTCGGLLDSFCVAMSAFGLTEASSIERKKSICKSCNKNKKLLKKEFNFKGFSLQDKITQETIDNVNTYLESINKSNFLEFIINGIPLGKFAAYEFFLNHKINSIDLSDEKFNFYKIHFKNTLLVFFIMNQYFRDHKPNIVICYNNLYSVNNIVCQIAKHNNIPYYSLHGGLNWSRPVSSLLISQESMPKLLLDAKLNWEKYKNYSCSKKEIQCISNYIICLTQKANVFVYSPAKKAQFFDLRKFFNINIEQKILVVTMSSLDERFTSELMGVLKKYNNLMFEDQLDWVKFLINEANQDKSIFVIIRVHPREFPNDREKITSPHAIKLGEFFQNLPKNVAINWPSQKISLYDLADIADVFLNAWSSAGIEMASLGLPVVLYSKELIFAPSDLFYIADSKDDYLNKIKQAIKDGWNFERIQRAYRWLNLTMEKIAFDISDSYTYKVPKKYFINRLIRKLYSYINPMYIQKDNCKKRAYFLKEGSNISELIKNNLENVFDNDFLERKYSHYLSDEKEEVKIIKEELLIICNKLYTDNVVKENSKLYAKLNQNC